MKFCPLMSYGKQYATGVDCFGKDCMLAADEAGNCLIQQALQLYVSQERIKLAEQAAIEEQQMREYFAAKAANNTRTAMTKFLENSSPISVFSYGAAYEDVNSCQKDRHPKNIISD